MASTFTCPEDGLAGEIELALTYITVCNRDARGDLLLGRRADFARAIAAMLTERAEKGLSGMSLAEEGWEPGRWWRVISGDGSLWCETSDEQEARADMRPGYELLRLWRRTDRKWRSVQEGQ